MDAKAQSQTLLTVLVVVVILLVVWMMMRYRKVTPAHMRPAQGSYLQGVTPYSGCVGICNDPIMRYDCATCICGKVCESKSGSGKQQCMARCLKGQPPAHLQQAGYDY